MLYHITSLICYNLDIRFVFYFSYKILVQISEVWSTLLMLVTCLNQKSEKKTPRNTISFPKQKFRN